MFGYSKIKTLTFLSYSLAAVVAASSLGGLLLPEIYAKETPTWGAQAQGQDFVDLIFVAPLLIFSAFLAQKGEKIFLFFQGGILINLVYAYMQYGFFLHFNRFYFLYCAGVGLSVYALVLYGMEFQRAKVESWFNLKKSTKLPSLYFLATTLVFYFLWLSEDIPAVISGIAPKSIDRKSVV